MSGCDVNESCLSVDKTATASANSREVSEKTEQPGYVSSKKSSTNKTPYSYDDQAVSESASDSHSSSSTEQSAASSSSNEEASESTKRVSNDATDRSNSDQTPMQSTVRPSDSATFIAPAKTDNGSDDEDNNDESGEEESDNDGTSEGDSDAEMEDTETSEHSEESDVPEPKHIEAWRKGIAKPECTGVPKSIRAASPTTTIAAAPIQRRTGRMKIKIFVKDRGMKSELKKLTEPELKLRLEREIISTKSRIQSCKVMPSGDIRLFTTDTRGTASLTRPRGWRPGAFGKGASVWGIWSERPIVLR